VPAASTEGESPKSGGRFGLSANQWIGIGSIGVSLLGIYYKREELKAMAKPVFDKFKMPEPAPEPASVEPEPTRATQPSRLKKCFKPLRVIHISRWRAQALRRFSSIQQQSEGLRFFGSNSGCVAVTLLANEMFADKGAQDIERRRKIKQEVREEIKIERKILEEGAAESGAPRGENFLLGGAGHSPAGKTD